MCIGWRSCDGETYLENAVAMFVCCSEPPSIVGSCRIDMQSYRRTLNTLASTSVALTSTKQPSNLVANVQLPEIVSAGLQALGLPPTTDPNSVIMDYRLIRWVDDPLQFADNGNDAAVASQVVTVDLVNSCTG